MTESIAIPEAIDGAMFLADESSVPFVATLAGTNDDGINVYRAVIPADVAPFVQRVWFAVIPGRSAIECEVAP